MREGTSARGFEPWLINHNPPVRDAIAPSSRSGFRGQTTAARPRARPTAPRAKQYEKTSIDLHVRDAYFRTSGKLSIDDHGAAAPAIAEAAAIDAGADTDVGASRQNPSALPDACISREAGCRRLRDAQCALEQVCSPC